MKRFFNNALVILQLVCYLAALSWAASPAAFAEELHEVGIEQTISSSMNVSADSWSNSSQVIDAGCNHSCHLANHIVSLDLPHPFSLSKLLTFKSFPIQEYSKLPAVTLPGQYRPPSL